MKVESKNINGQNRYVIVNDNGDVVDDAQGYGYKTYQNATKVIWYRSKKGKSKINRGKKFWKKNPDVKEWIDDIISINFKEISRNEVSYEDIRKEAEEKFNIYIDKSYMKYL